jgi:hypothetical protein
MQKLSLHKLRNQRIVLFAANQHVAQGKTAQNNNYAHSDGLLSIANAFKISQLGGQFNYLRI